MKKVALLSITFCLFLIACKKENTQTIIPEIPQITITSSLYGQVIDESGAALEGVSISVGGHNLTTDENGFFVFTDISMNEYGTYIKAEKAGYFMGAKFVEPSGNSRSYTKIKLLEKTLSGTISTSDGGIIITNNEASVSFLANSFQFENGETYSGIVNVFAKYLAPQSNDIQEIMPGDLRGSDRDGEFVQLATYGMIAVELETPDGERLNLKSGKKATLEMPIPNDLLNNAPTTIPLWYLNEETGHWIEEGSANLEDGKYVGEVSHFSFWNCDAPFPVIDFSGKLVDELGNPFANSLVKITLNSSALVGTGYTDSEGVFSGKVAKDEEITLEVIGLCEEVIHSETVGPFSEEADIGSLIIESPDYSYIGFSGILINCDGEFVENGYAKLTMGEKEVLIFTDVAGIISTSLMVCGNELEILAFDLDNAKMSEPTSFEVLGVNNIDIGLFEVCSELTEYFYLNFGDTDYLLYESGYGQGLFAINTIFDIPTFAIDGTDPDKLNIYFEFFSGLENLTTVTHQTFLVHYSDLTAGGDTGIIHCSYPNCDNVFVTITEMDSQEKWIKGNITGSFTGEFRIFN